MFITKLQISQFQEKQDNKGINVSCNFQHTHNEAFFFDIAVWSFPVMVFKTANLQK